MGVHTISGNKGIGGVETNRGFTDTHKIKTCSICLLVVKAAVTLPAGGSGLAAPRSPVRDRGGPRRPAEPVLVHSFSLLDLCVSLVRPVLIFLYRSRSNG